MTRRAGDTLARCGVTELMEDGPTLALGKLGPFLFRKRDSARYFSVDGPMPLEAARELYADPVARRDVRAGCHAGAEHPDKHVTWRLGEEEVVPDPDGTVEAEYHACCARLDIAPRTRLFTKDPAAIGAEAFVESYHVDSELGLYVLVQRIKRLLGDDPMAEYLEHFRARVDDYERLIANVQRKDGPNDDLDHLQGFFKTIRQGRAFPLRFDDDVERALQRIAGDLRYHRGALVRCLEHVGPVDALGSFIRLCRALESSGAGRRA